MKLFGSRAEGRPRRRRHGRRLSRGAAPARPRPARARPPSKRRPARPARRIRWPRPGQRTGRLAVFAVVVAGALLAGYLGGDWIVERPFLAVREVRVEGAAHADAAELEELAGIPEGAPWLALDASGIRFRLESHPWVARARVSRPWPGRVVLRVKECVPLARIHVDQRPYGLCEDLRIVPLADGEGADLPLIRDFAAGLGADPEALERGLEYVRALGRLGVEHGIRLDLRRDDHDVIALPDRGFVAEVDAPLPAGSAARRVAAFLERLDEQGGGRGTLRLISEGTAVWRASA